MAGSLAIGADRVARAAGPAAAACFFGALAGFGAALDGYVHADWPVALLGASGVPRAAGFNLAAYVLPGLLAALVALRLRARLLRGAPWALRMGWSLALVAAVAFATQGLLPLDAEAPDAGSGRLHGVAWALWALAFAATALALAVAAIRARRPAAALVHLCAGVGVLTPAWLPDGALPVALAQRIAFAAWFAWLVWAPWNDLPGPCRTE